jgi:hypothetical protein
MPWFRIDDTFADHPKVTDAGNAAAGLWVRCGTYSSRFLLDGLVPEQIARRYGGRREIDRLVASRLWLPVDDGYLMPDFLDYNPSAEQVKLERKRAAERQRRQRAKGYSAVDHDDAGRFMSRRDKRTGGDDVTP